MPRPPRPSCARNRDSIPFSHLPWMPEVLGGAREDFPAVFQYRPAVTGVEAAGKELGSFITENLHRFGASVVKGLPVGSTADFSELMHASGLELRDYVGGVTTRPLEAPKVTPASGEGPHVSMEPHNDNPYWPRPMLRLVLFCRQPPRSGGQAQLTDGRRVLQQLQREHPNFVADLKRRKVRYVHFYPDAEAFHGVVINSWQAAYAAGCNSSASCDMRKVAEEALRRDGRGYEWTPTGLRQWEVSDVVKVHPVTGEETWTSQLTAMHCTVFDNHPEYVDLHRSKEAATSEQCFMQDSMPYHTTFGDGEEFPIELLEAVRRAQWAHSVAFDYELGDVVLIDNYLAMHGRFSFEGPRELYITLVGGRNEEVL